MIWELAGKMTGAVVLVALIAAALAEKKRRQINLIAWQKRTQAAMAAKRAEMEQAAADEEQAIADRKVCNELELLPVSEESND